MRYSARWLFAAVFVEVAFGCLFLMTECQDSLQLEAEAAQRQRAAEADPAEGVVFQNVDVAWSPAFKLFALAMLLLFGAVPGVLLLVLYRGTRLQRLAALASLASWTVLFALLLKAGAVQVPAEFCTQWRISGVLEQTRPMCATLPRARESTRTSTASTQRAQRRVFDC